MSFIDWDDVYDPREINTTDGIRKVKIARDLLPRLNRFGGWYGNRAAAGYVAVAWVGEKLGQEGDERWPPLFWGRSGSFLLRALGSLRHRSYFTNAVKPSWADPDLKRELLETVLPDAIVALGKRSKEVLRQHGVTDIVEAPHPSWVLRFRSKEKETFAKLYRDLVTITEERRLGHEPPRNPERR